MFFDKRKYIVNIEGGSGLANTDKVIGMVVHMIVRPESRDTVWDLLIYDKEGDELLEIYEHTGRLDMYCGLPVGKENRENITIRFSEVSKNEPIKVIFKIKELE